MTASELIKKLQALILEHGDLDVRFPDDGGAYGDFSIGGVCSEPESDGEEDYFLIY